ncbi:nucleotide-binding protein [Bacillus sp. FSL R10-2201]|uniref:nucleotide-binding protein n=1 Tax=Bacillus sp. FSL R10-2201 TaxID=2954657 RepID=UPI0030F63E9A
MVLKRQVAHFHTGIHTKNAFRNVYELDTSSQNEIIEEVIIPYLKNEKIHFDGYFIEPESIDRIIIKRSHISSKKFLEIEEELALASRVVSISRASDIMNNEEYTTDITKIMFSLAKDKLREEGHTTDEFSNSVIVTNNNAANDESEIDRTKVFIVHGHDDFAKTQVSDLIRRLGLRPIILHQQANEGKTIIEKIESHSNVGYGVVLYTPCDLGSKAGEEDNLNPRARQNVVFEHGFLIGKIGRKNVAALVKDTVETPNDISGVVYISMGSEGSWELQLAKELRSSGYAIDLNDL